MSQKLEETNELLTSLKSDSGHQMQANETQLTEIMERMRGKELVIDQNANEMR